ncbi:hypothetical protein [Komagataeibacter swingsii]|nr:hypothetical protein [Komagataeibacter swingsii]
MSLSGEDIQYLQKQTPSNTPPVSLSPADQALLWANLKPYNRIEYVAWFALILGVFVCIPLFFKQYRWKKASQKLEKVGIGPKLGVFLIGVVSTAVQLMKFQEMGQ